jgi:hypothetical protein
LNRTPLSTMPLQAGVRMMIIERTAIKSLRRENLGFNKSFLSHRYCCLFCYRIHTNCYKKQTRFIFFYITTKLKT